jgi:hypothetical protein
MVPLTLAGMQRDVHVRVLVPNDTAIQKLQQPGHGTLLRYRMYLRLVESI